MTASHFQFSSTIALERALDGTEAAFARYFFAIYHCMPDEAADLNARRDELRRQYPADAIAIGDRFVLTGRAARLILAKKSRLMSQEMV